MQEDKSEAASFRSGGASNRGSVPSFMERLGGAEESGHDTGLLAQSAPAPLRLTLGCKHVVPERHKVS